MEDWFSTNPDDGTSEWGERAAILYEVKQEWVQARVDFLEMAGAIAGELWKFDRTPADEVNAQFLSEKRINFRDRGRTERSLRSQWAEALRVNPEPCPF